jgi:aspartate carbamoyltransferase
MNKNIFQKTKLLKEAWLFHNQNFLDQFRIGDNSFGIYEVFLEDSTRTRESFRNAAAFHGVKLSMFNSDSSSFNKSESYADGFMTLVGYQNHIFIVRSKLEGVCRWLEIKGKQYAERNQLGFVPAFINAGDGMHEHPTQELLDDFTLLEDNDWKKDFLHIALVGDLFHGRTVHSKAEGLEIFDSVMVDLIAPPELAMPEQYIQRMKKNGFHVREFHSLQAYFSQTDIANRFYFTRPQLERMGDDILKRQNELRDTITFKREYISKLHPNTFFYHPLPQNKTQPTIPAFLEDSSLNHWETQSINGMFIRSVLLGLISGKMGDDFLGKSISTIEYPDDFIREVNPSNSKQKVSHDGINPLPNGVVIDHLSRGNAPAEIWQYLTKTMKIMGFETTKGFMGVGESKKEEGTYKGLLFLPEIKELSDSDIRRLAAATPGCTVNIINNNRVIRKLRLSLPPRIHDIDGTGCKNDACISHFSHLENVPPEFIRGENDLFECLYCGTPHKFKDIWK